MSLSVARPMHRGSLPTSLIINISNHGFSFSDYDDADDAAAANVPPESYLSDYVSAARAAANVPAECNNDDHPTAFSTRL